jgi:tRNA pseudouridine38-40 synthase
MLVEYEGTRYHGWQVQTRHITVQQVIEEALAILCKHPVRIVAAGRTDAGVHAIGQVAGFFTEKVLDIPKTLFSLNALTPWDVAILDFAEGPDGFDARRWATGREYCYRILNRRVPNVLWRRFTWHQTHRLDVDAMQSAANHLIGLHDFSSFRGAGCASKSPERQITKIDFTRQGDIVEMTIGATGFLKHMVRNVVGTLSPIGLGKYPPQSILDVLNAKDRAAAGPTAPPEGLVFTRVDYPNEVIGLSPQSAISFDGQSKL